MTKTQQDMIQKVLEFSIRDSRLIGLAISGSYITKSLDEYSDLDFVIVVEDKSYEEVNEQRLLIVEQFGTLVSAFTGEHVGEPRLIISLYDSPVLHVDFKFTTLNGLLDRVEDSVILYEENNCITEMYSKKEPHFPTPDLQWIEDRFWIWVHYACTKIGRRELFETIDFLSFLRQSVLAPLIQLHLGKLPRGVRKIELDAPQYIEALEKTVATHDYESCVNALKATINLYLELREKLSQSSFFRKVEAERVALRYFHDLIK
ncbi:oxalate:formate antiporter [Erysipelothrix larvae]|uniref:Oxalate:formate antiporter n=1 Tax=Erysipelothrix larvae TaxID=1514105 RepID=A0A0X8GZ76_9FIRM|nr:aminoglycoside 6-adenylyltransferase [Erysipelothrix larvae]AMC93127.1 oxalate:formate antiporter [Erysipelothrix larvae]